MLNNFTGLTQLRHVRFTFNKWEKSYKKPFLQCLSSLDSLEYLQITGSNCDFGFPCDNLIVVAPQHLQKLDMATTMDTVPKWITALRALTNLHISLLSLGEEELHVLNSIPSLSHLHISLEESTESSDKELVISSAYPFLSLIKIEICTIKRLVFAQGVMPNIQSLVLKFGKLETMDQLGDFVIGIENLSSLSEVYVSIDCPKAMPEELKAAKAKIKIAVDMNKNKPSLDMPKVYVLKLHLHCEACSNGIKKRIYKMKGVQEVSIDDWQQGEVRVHCPSLSSPTELIKYVKRRTGKDAALLDYF
ncbi:unnamed protein product [Urochloa humidicola]